ncbi:hypothetical protein V6N13_134772 [Hibiscus sabdariffa]
MTLITSFAIGLTWIIYFPCKLQIKSLETTDSGITTFSVYCSLYLHFRLLLKDSRGDTVRARVAPSHTEMLISGGFPVLTALIYFWSSVASSSKLLMGLAAYS